MNHRAPCSVRRADAMNPPDRAVWVLRHAPDRALLMSPRRAPLLVTYPRIPIVQATCRTPGPEAPVSRRPSLRFLAARTAPSLECGLIGNPKTRTWGTGVEQPISSSGPTDFAHRILDRLTAMKLRIGSVRLRLRLGAIAQAEIENHLDHIEQEIDAAAALAQDMQAEGTNSR
jgi:hypothetical protein